MLQKCEVCYLKNRGAKTSLFLIISSKESMDILRTVEKKEYKPREEYKRSPPKHTMHRCFFPVLQYLPLVRYSCPAEVVFTSQSTAKM